MEIHNISDWEKRIINTNENNKIFFDQNMIYKAKIIGNTHDATSVKCRADKELFDKVCTYEYSGLIIKIVESRMVNHLEEVIKTCDVIISEENNHDEPVYISYIKYVPGDWIQKFETLFEESINIDVDQKQKIYEKNKELH